MGIEDVARKNVVSVNSDTPVEEVARTMFDRNVGSVVVEEGGELRGIVTDRDLTVELLAEDGEMNVFREGVDPSGITARDVMTTDPLTVGPHAEIPAVIERMRDAIARRVPVVDDGEAVGIVAIDDILVHIAGEHERLSAELTAISDVIEAESPRT